MEKTTRVFDEIWTALSQDVRYVDSCGGTRSGKTYAMLQTLIILCMYDTIPCITSIVSESLPHLKRGAIRDFKDIMVKEKLWDRSRWHDSDKIYTFPNGGKIEFFSADTPAKVHGPARDRLFLNEAQNIPYTTVRQLFVRTRKTIFIDYNPTREFWVHNHIKGSGKEYTIHSTYTDNPFLTEEQIAEIESNRNDKEWWQVYGLGLTGRPQGLVFTNWDTCAEIPQDAKLVGHGLDFGFTADPTAIVDVYKYGGNIYLDEKVYKHGMTNDMIASELHALKHAATVADSAEMKSITEIRNYGIRNIEPSIKGPDSVRMGIQVMKRYKMYVTKRSLNLIKEFRNYMWKIDNLTGEILNVPVDKYNHGIDAVRYCMGNLLSERPHISFARARTTNY